MNTIGKLTSGGTPSRRAEHRFRYRWRAGLCASLGVLGVATAGALMGYRRDRVQCVLVQSPATVTAGEHALVRFRLINRTGRTVQLRPRHVACWRTRLEGVLAQLRPHESREVAMVLNTRGLNGPQSFAAAISTNATPRVIMAKAEVIVNVDWLVKRFTLGTLPAVKRIQIDNVPAAHLVRVGSPSNQNWSARVVSAVGRSIEIELAAVLPALDDLEPPSRRSVCDFSVYFSEADVRRLQVIATASVAYDEGDRGHAGLSSLR